MNAVVLQQIVFWSWLVLSVSATAFAGFFFVKYLADRENQDALEMTVLQLVLHTAIGMIFASLICLGHPASGVWAWRILSRIMAVVGVGIVIRVQVDTPVTGWKAPGQVAFAAS